MGILTRSVILTYLRTRLRLEGQKGPIWNNWRKGTAMSLNMDDRDGFIWLDGKLVPWRDSRVHVLTHALHYGSAAFEGARPYRARAFPPPAPRAPPATPAPPLPYET